MSVKDIKAAIRKATLAYQIVPVLCGSALRNKGVQPVLDAVADYLPSPLDLPPVEGIDPKTEETITRKPNPDGPLAGLAFKIVMEQGRKLTYVRLYSGRMKVGQAVYLPRGRAQRESGPGGPGCTPTSGSGWRRPRPGTSSSCSA